MRFSRLFIFFLIVCVPLLLPSEAVAIGCWLCQNQLDTCKYYRLSEFEWCIDGCQRNPYVGCLSWCQSTYLSGLAACQADYNWCADGCANRDGGPGGGGPQPNCPIVLDLSRHGWRFTSAGEGVLFDIDGDGLREWIAWTDPEAEVGFLAWDRDLNGVIDSGRELFGDSTVQPPSNAPNGFLALALMDQAESGGNGDGVISEQDGLWGALQVWVDRNHNGRSEEDELSPLSAHKVAAIDLAFRESRRKDRYGNELRYRTKVLMDDGPATNAVDVFFQRLP